MCIPSMKHPPRLIDCRGLPFAEARAQLSWALLGRQPEECDHDHLEKAGLHPDFSDGSYGCGSSLCLWLVEAHSHILLRSSGSRYQGKRVVIGIWEYGLTVYSVDDPDA